MGRAAWARRKATLLVAAAALAAGIGVLAYATGLLGRTELQTIDARFSVRGTQTPPSNIVLVEIDNTTFQELEAKHLKSEFPFPRRYDAQVVNKLRQDGAKVIAMDMEFTHETDPADDNALIEAIAAAHGKTVLATTEVGEGGSTGIFGGSKSLLREIGTRPAEVILTLDSDGVARRFAYSKNGLQSFAVVTAEVSTGRRVAASLFKGETLPTDYVGPPFTIKAVPYSDVLLHKFPPNLFRGKIVIVGASAAVLQDVHATATSGKETMPGPEIWANDVATLLKGIPLKDAAGWADILLIVLLGALTPLSSLRIRPWRALADALAAAVAFTVAVQLAFNSGWILSFVYPLLALALGTLATLAILYLSEAIERERTHDLFSRFVPADVVDQVLASTNENLRLGGVERDCTVLFSDLRGFTSFSETQTPEKVIEVVNYYLNEMTEAILAAGGTLIAYMGDGIMAVFGAPLEQEDHADRALTAAREMIGTRLEHFNDWLAAQGHEHRFKMGVGLNSGPVMAGNVGAERRVEYTAIGDTTNTASRLESMTKGSGTMLFVSQTTRDRMRSAPEDLMRHGEVEIRGREAKLTVWTLDSSLVSSREPQARPTTADPDGSAVPSQ